MTKHISITLFGLFCMVIAAAWLVIGTETGTRWLVAHLLELSPATVKVAKVEGRLADHLVLSDLKVDWNDGAMSINKLDLEWSPWTLPLRKLKISRLTFDTVTVKTAGSNEAPAENIALAWPELPLWLVTWKVEIDAFKLNQMDLQQKGSQALTVQDVNGSVQLDQGRALLPSIKGNYLDYQAKGSFDLNLRKPAAKGNLDVSSDTTGDACTLTFDLQQDASSQFLVGPASGTVTAFKQPEYHFRGHLRLNSEDLALDDLEVSQVGHNGVLTGHLVIDWQEAPELNTEMAIKAWPIHLDDEDLLLDGLIDAAGTPEDFHGSFNLATSGRETLILNLTGELHGEHDRLSLLINQGTWLGSDLTGEVQTDWKEQTEVRSSLKLRGLDPARLDKQWSGLVNLDVDLGILQGTATPTVLFDAHFTDSRLHDLPLNGVASGTWKDNILTIRQARLNGDGFSLKADGSLASRLNLTFEISSLQKLLPQAGGQLSGRGWVARLDDTWVGNLSATGKQLVYDQLALDTASLDLTAPTPGQPAKLTLSGRELHYGGLLLSALGIEVKAQKGVFDASLDTSLQDGEARASLTVRQEDNDWLGTLKSFRLSHSELGEWKLSTPVIGRVSLTGLVFEDLNLSGQNGRLHASGHLRSDGTPDQLQAQLEHVPLSLFSSLLGPVKMTGELDMSLACQEQSCRLEADGIKSVRYQGQNVEFSKTLLDGTWNSRGLRIESRLDLTNGGYLTTLITSDSPLQGDIP